MTGSKQRGSALVVALVAVVTVGAATARWADSSRRTAVRSGLQLREAQLRQGLASGVERAAHEMSRQDPSWNGGRFRLNDVEVLIRPVPWSNSVIVEARLGPMRRQASIDWAPASSDD